MTLERSGAVMLGDTPMTLVGAELSVGDKAPDFVVLANDLSEVTLASGEGKTRLILSLLSVDTPVCDAETRRFNESASTYPNLQIYTISCDLPSALTRWCGAAGIEAVRTLSDHKDTNFGRAYGTLIKEIRLLSRAVFLIDAGGMIQYVEYVAAIGEQPDYEAAHRAIKRLS